MIKAAPKIHYFAADFPPLSPDDYAALRESIKTHGQFSPIVLSDSGEILDGKNRWEICTELGITPRTIRFSELSAEFPDTSEIQFIYGCNAARRHLTPQQKAVLALAFLPAVRKEARARQQAGCHKGLAAQKEMRNGNRSHKPAPESNRTKNQTVVQMAKKAGCGVPVMRASILVHDHDPALLPALANGSLSAAEATKIVAAKRNGATPSKPVSLEKRVLDRWKATWIPFIRYYPKAQREEVRRIVLANLGRASTSETSVASC